MENYRLTKRECGPDLNMCSVATGQQHYEHVSISYSSKLGQCGVRVIVRAYFALMSPIKCALPPSIRESLQQHFCLRATILPRREIKAIWHSRLSQVARFRAFSTDTSKRRI